MPITVTVMNYSNKKEDEPIGSYTASLNTIVNESGNTYEISNKKSKKRVNWIFWIQQISRSQPSLIIYEVEFNSTWSQLSISLHLTVIQAIHVLSTFWKKERWTNMKLVFGR